MIKKYMNKVNDQKLKSKGFSLIELLIAVVIGIIMLAALITLFTNFSNMNKAQSGLARLQENGRYLTMRMKKDIENVGFQPCATISMDSPQRIDEGFATRPLISFAFNTNGMRPVGTRGAIDTQYLIQGHECSTGTCVPALGVSPGGDPYGKVPAIGTTAGKRANKTDVLTVRYLSSEAINVDDTVNASTDTEFSLASDPTQPPLSLTTSDDILIANCFNAMIIPVANIGGNRVKVANILGASVSWASKGSISSVYNFTKDFLTVTYYIGLKDHPDDASQKISSLYRIENGSAPQELVEGVERFDLTYGVQLKSGLIGYMTATEINGATAATDCIAVPIIPSQFPLLPLVNGSGCLWRSVFSVKINALLNTVYKSAATNTEKYIYSPDGLTPVAPTNPLLSGVSPGYMYRKEFTETISLQSNNL